MECETRERSKPLKFPVVHGIYGQLPLAFPDKLCVKELILLGTFFLLFWSLANENLVYSERKEVHICSLTSPVDYHKLVCPFTDYHTFPKVVVSTQPLSLFTQFQVLTPAPPTPSGGMEENTPLYPGWCGSVHWAPACKPKGCRFHCQSGHSLGCGPGPQLGAQERQPHLDVSIPLFLLPFPSL